MSTFPLRPPPSLRARPVLFGDKAGGGYLQVIRLTDFPRITKRVECERRGELPTVTWLVDEEREFPTLDAAWSNMLATPAPEPTQEGA